MSGRILGIITAVGGMTSHAAVVAREFNIPTIVGCGPAVMGFLSGQLVTLNATKGTAEAVKLG